MAFLKGSFYETVRRFEPDESGETPFRGVRARRLDAPEPILEHSVAMKDRTDSLAHHFYSDSRGWRRIADANPDAIFFEDLIYDPDPKSDDPANPFPDENGRERLGDVILIPRRRESR